MQIEEGPYLAGTDPRHFVSKWNCQGIVELSFTVLTPTCTKEIIQRTHLRGFRSWN